jgi:hypothetical protein
MHLLRAATFGAVLSHALVASQATAQEKRFKEAIVGPWVITSVFDEYENDEKRDNWGGPVSGQLTFGRRPILHDHHRSLGCLDEDRRPAQAGRADRRVLRFVYRR